MNPITAKFKATRDSKKSLRSVSPEKNFTNSKKVRIEYDNGSEDTFIIDLDHNSFVKEWEGFNQWFEKLRETESKET